MTPRNGLKAMNFVLCLNIVLVIGKYRDFFLGGAGVGGYFHEETFPMGREFPMEGELDFLPLFKTDQKLNTKKTSYFQLKVRINVQT